MGRSQAQGLPRVALADVPACSASPRGIRAINEAPACDALAHSLAPSEPGQKPVCRAAGCRHRSGSAGHGLPGWSLARSRDRNGWGEFAATASLFPDLPQWGALGGDAGAGAELVLVFPGE